jgi:hypothetical protein
VRLGWGPCLLQSRGLAAPARLPFPPLWQAAAWCPNASGLRAALWAPDPAFNPALIACMVCSSSGRGPRWEEERVLTLDELFKKTVGKPCIYWLPLTGARLGPHAKGAWHALCLLW